MVMEETGAYKEHYEDIRKRTASAALAPNTLLLSRSACDRFFAIVEGREIETETCRGTERGLNFYGANRPFVSGLRGLAGKGLRSGSRTN